MSSTKPALRAPSSIGKALAVFDVLISASDGVLGVSDIAEAMQAPKSTVHRLLAELELHGLVGRVGRKYQVGGKVFEMVAAAQRSVHGHLRDVAVPVLAALFDRVGLTVHLAVLEGDDVLIVEKITGPGGCAIPTQVGARLPAHCTALGKAMLASRPFDGLEHLVPLAAPTPYSTTSVTLLREQLAEVQRRGFAHEFEETRLGTACVAAALPRPDGPSAMSIAGPVRCIEPVQLGPLLREAASVLARLLEP